MMTSNGFSQAQKTYIVTITWKHGFTHSYEQKLNDKQLVNEQLRINAYQWINNVNFTLIR